MNVERLLAVKERILAEPENFDMSRWHCGTAHCIGGWAQVLFGAQVVKNCYKGLPRQLLDLTHEQARLLCYASLWPVRFGGARPYPTAAEGAARIDEFIANEGTK